MVYLGDHGLLEFGLQRQGVNEFQHLFETQDLPLIAPLPLPFTCDAAADIDFHSISNLVDSFREFVNPGYFSDTGKDGIDSQTWSGERSLEMPSPTLDIPTQVFTGEVTNIRYNTNPITVYINVGREWRQWSMNHRQWKYLESLGKAPRIGSKVQIEQFLDGTIKAVNYIAQ